MFNMYEEATLLKNSCANAVSKKRQKVQMQICHIKSRSPRYERLYNT